MMAETEPSGSSRRSVTTAPRKDTARSPTKTSPEDCRLPGVAVTKSLRLEPGLALDRQRPSVGTRPGGGRGEGARPWPATGLQLAGAGPSGRQAGRWARPKESFHPPSRPDFLPKPRRRWAVKSEATQLDRPAVQPAQQWEKEKGRA